MIERAEIAAAELRPLSDAALEGGSDGLAALYAVLALPLHDQPEAAALLDAANADSPLQQAVVAEDARLQSVSKERSYRAGSYMHYLRHRLGDLVLIANIPGGIHGRAFGLLQQRVDDAAEQQPLIALIPAETREKYARWALQPANVAAQQRTLSVLELVRRDILAPPDRRVLGKLLEDPNPVIAAEAARTAIHLGSSVLGLAGAVTRLVNELPDEAAERLAREAAVADASLIRLAALSPDRLQLVFRSRATAVSLLNSALRALQELDEVRASAVVEALTHEGLELPPDELQKLFDGMVSRNRRQGGDVLKVAFQSPQLRAQAWAGLGKLAPEDIGAVVLPLLASEPAPRTAQMKHALMSADPSVHELLASQLIDAGIDEVVEPAEVAAAWPAERLGQALKIVRERCVEATATASAAEEALRRGLPGRLDELRQELAPLITLARDRVEGNPTLESGLERLLLALQPGEDVDASPVLETDDLDAASIFDSMLVREELAPLGIEVRGGVLVANEDGSSFERRARYLATLDQRAQLSGPQAADAKLLLREYIAVLGHSGEAVALLAALFEGNPLARLMIRLQPSTREALVRAMLANEAHLDPKWFEHPGLGEWLLEVSAHTDGDPNDVAESRTPVEHFAEALRAAASAEARRRRALEAVRRQLSVAKEQFALQADDAFSGLDAVLDAYLELRRGLARHGIAQAAQLGARVARSDLDPSRHHVTAGARAGEFVVRSPGLAVDGQILSRAQVEGID